jgi:hypothetical protein
VGAGTPGVALIAALEPALECLPAEALRAFIRLQLASVAARYHLAGAYATGWGGFIAVGPTKTCKTIIATLVCRAFGLDEAEAIRILRLTDTPGSILGRRVADRDSPTGYRLRPSPKLDLPYLCLDELDKASPDVRAAVGALLLGTTRVELEGEVRTIHPLIYTALNSRGGLRELDDPYVRRSVVIDTAVLRELLVDADLAMARLFDASGRIPRLSLERLTPPLSVLPPDLWRLLRDELRHGLTEEGWALTDTESLARVVLGRAAFTHGDLEQDVLVVALDALCCASTLGHTVLGYTDRLASRLGAGVMIPDHDAAERERRQLVTRRLSRQLEHAMKRDQLVEDRGRLERMLDEAIDRLDLRRLKDCSPQQRVEAHGIGERLREVRADITAARTRDALTAAEARARDPVCRGGELHQQIERERIRRAETENRLRPIQRTRGSANALLRDMAANIKTALADSHGAELDVLDQRSRQLIEAPPMSPAEQQRHIQALARHQVELARGLEIRGRLEESAGRLNPYG